MTGPCFADSNVAVYAFDHSQPKKQAVAQALLSELLQARKLILSTQVLNETYVVLTRKQKLTRKQAHEAVEFLAHALVLPVDLALTQRAMKRHEKEEFQYWDALIFEAALEAGCTTLYSEDFQHGRRFGKLTVKNPFT